MDWSGVTVGDGWRACKFPNEGLYVGLQCSLISPQGFPFSRRAMAVRESSIYRSPKGRETLAALYSRRLAGLGPNYQSRWVATGLGRAHALVVGDGPPLVLLHGAASSAVDLADTFGWLGHRCRRYFVDLPGEPGRSSEARPGKAGPGYGHWMREVLEGLGLEQTRVFGLSLGAFVALKTASVIPERIVRMALLVPEGLAKPRMIPFARSVTWPAIRYLVSRSDADAHRFVRALGDHEAMIPERFLEQVAHYMRHVKGPPKPAPLLDAEELSRLHAPVLVVTGGKDPLFPGDRVARRAGAVIPNLREAIVVPRAGHVYFPEPQSVVGRRLQDFLVADD